MKVFFLLLSMLPISPIFGQCWNLVWEDEFNGTTLDAAKWTPLTGGGGWGNNELQNYTARPENLGISNGTLKLIARSEVFGGNNYTSARIRSLQKGDWTYGKFEARMKLSVAQGMWPAFWMMPTDNTYGNWPNSGEIDIMELIGKFPSRMYGTLHTSSATAGVSTATSANYDLSSGNFSDAFHNFAIEWSPNEIKWFMDGILYSTKKPADFSGFPWRFDKDFHIILNLAVGGNWPGAPNASTIFPQTTEVEYVRVYQKNSDLAVKGLAIVEPTATTTYKVPTIAATTYNWSVPAGTTVISGQGSSEISVKWGSVSGDITCSITTPCGTTSATKTIEVTPNLLKNWSFESNFQNWTTTVSTTAAATFSSPTDATAPNGTRIAYVNTTAVSPSFWHVQIVQVGLTVEAGVAYTCKFKAKSSATSKRMRASILNSTNYSTLGGQTFSLDGNWKEYSFTFTPTISVAAQVNLDFGYDIAAFYIDNIVFGKADFLPVDIIGFQLFSKNNNAQLAWQVGNEVHLLRYDIERSMDGKAFKKIGEVAAKNGQNYTYEDTETPSESTLYYRLKTVNSDFTEGYSKILSYRSSPNFEKIKVFPNPISDVLFVETVQKVRSIEAIDGSGRVFNIPFTTSTNGVLGEVERLAAGIFKLRITFMNGTSEQISVVKKK
jgi:beta-glucanase (GH16 family)